MSRKLTKVKTFFASLMLLLMLVLALVPMLALAQESNLTPYPLLLEKGATIKSASEYDYPPFSIVTADGKADGFSVELLRAALNATGYDVNFKVGPWAEIKEELAEGKIQVLPLVGRTPEREMVYDFSVPYISLYGAIFIRKGDVRIRSIDDLKDKEVLVMKGDNAEEFALRGNVSSKIIATDTYDEAFRLLSEGKHDAIIAQRLVGIQILDVLNISSIVPLADSIPGFKQDFTFAVKEGDAELLSVINDGLSKIMIDGTFEKINEKWFSKLNADLSKPRYVAQDPADQNDSLIQLSIRIKALEVAHQVDSYIREHPEKTIAQLQNDSFFNSLAVQKLRTTGYTALVDSSSGIFYFHPQKSLINQDSHQFSASLPSFWTILEQTIGPACKESSGLYDWKEDDGSVSEKYMYIACVKSRTADGKSLFVGATAYLDELDASRYLNAYDVKEFSSFAQDSIRQKAMDVAKQLEMYITARPGMTVADFQNDSYFQAIAVQLVGKTGYTAVADVNTLINRFHQNPKIVNLDLSTLAEKLPGFWRIMSKTIGGLEAGGVYDWQEADGSITQKYMYIAVVDALTGDGVRLNVAATTYLDEYENLPADILNQTSTGVEDPAPVALPEEKNILLGLPVFWQVLSAVILVMILFFILRMARIGTSSVLLILGLFAFLLTALLIFNTFRTVDAMRTHEISSQSEFLAAIAYSRADYLTKLQESYLEELRLVSFRPLIRQEFDKYLKGVPHSEEHIILHFQEIANYTPHIDSISLLDKKGAVIISSDPSQRGDDYSSEDYFSLAKQKEIFKLAFDDGKPEIHVLGPVYGLQGTRTILGVMLIKIRADDLIKAFSDENYMGKTGEIYMVDGNGSMIFLPRNFPANKFYDDRQIDTAQTRLCIEHHFTDNTSGQQFTVEKEYLNQDYDNIYQDYRNQPVIGVHVFVPWLSSCIIAEKDESEILASIRESSINIWYSTLGIVIGILLLAVMSVYLLTSNMRKEIRSKTDEIAKINANLEEMIQSRTDELEKLNKELESRVDTRTRELNMRVKELTDTRTAILNILEDVNASKEEIESSHDKLIKINKEMKKANEELKKADYYKNQFISITAHELKTPLASIHGFANLLQNKKILSNTKQRDNYLSIIMQDSDRLKRLIDDILDLSRLDVGTMKFIFENVDVHEIFKDVMKEMYILASKNNLSLKASVAEDVPVIIADKSRLSQVLINLVSNSVKYNATKGGKIIIRAERHGRSVLFSVKDTGIGIPKKSQAKIFQRFYQVESWLTRKVGGSGLGLSICKGIVEALGGKIWFKSEEGRGSTFFFTLPVSRKVDFEKEQNLSVVKAPEEEGKDKSENGNKKSELEGNKSRIRK